MWKNGSGPLLGSWDKECRVGPHTIAYRAHEFQVRRKKLCRPCLLCDALNLRQEGEVRH